MALVKYNNNSISSVTALGSLPAGGLNLITTNTITSGVSSSSFTSNINSTYDTYMFKFINIHPASDSFTLFQVNFNDGSSDLSKTTTAFRTFHTEAGGSPSVAYQTGDDLANSTAYQILSVNQGNGNDESLSGELYLFSPSSTTFVKHFICQTMGYQLNNAANGYNIAGYVNSTSAVTDVIFKFDNGNIDSGIIKMYGLSKSWA